MGEDLGEGDIPLPREERLLRKQPLHQGPCLVITGESDEWTDDAHGAYEKGGGGGLG
jgi:hypothetical protein